ncbi:MAG: hypothetical protein Q4Q03_04945, partial [Bowdeniella nasicola]|nr:hypothetical protein [Bowdeniella nasicola]
MTTMPLTASTTSQGHAAPIQWRFPGAAIVMALLTVLLAATSGGESVLSMRNASRRFPIGDIHLDSTTVTIVLAVMAIIAAAGATRRAIARARGVAAYTTVAGTIFVLAFLIWSVAGNASTMPVVQLLQGSVAFAVPLILGALSGVVCERSG